MIKIVTMGLVALSTLSGAAIAHPATEDPVRATQAVAQLSPRDGGAQIELANALVRAGRADEAVKYYRRAMALDNVMLETRGGDAIWSHQVATHMLGNAPQLAAR